MNFFNTFRGRLLIILICLIIASLGVQYYFNYRIQRENIELRGLQSQALVAGIALGTAGLTSEEERVLDLMERPGQTFLDDASRERIIDIIIIDDNWQVSDSLSESYWPTVGADGKLQYRMLGDLTDLPPLIEGKRLGDDLKFFPNKRTAENENSDNEAHAVPIDTSKGRWYVMVLLRDDKGETARRAVRPMLVTLAILSISTLITFMLVWRFTRPIANLSDAARRVADGDLCVRVPDDNRTDEMGTLAARFNEMTAELTKTRELEAQLQQAEKSAVIGRLGSAIAHEIRNPLNYINLTLDHLKAKYSPEEPERQEKFQKLTSQLKNEVARINQQISDFLNYSRPATPNLQPIEAREVVADSLRIVEAQAAENDISVSLVERGEVPKISADKEYLRSVFNNLLINAVQAMGNEGGSLTIVIEPDSDKSFVRFEISDTGNGIPEENTEKIFEPYFSTKETGTGLGLAIVQKIVEMHGGTVEVRSKEGSGTTFTVKLVSIW